MVVKIELEADAPVETLVERFEHCWESASVVHVTGRRFDDESEMRVFYDTFMESAGTPADIGEDALALDNRGVQRTGQRWTEIRYEPTVENAYRHSPNPQPLHTDGSYVPDFPDAAIIYCQSSAAHGGETIFIDGEALLAAMRAEAPELLEALTGRVMPHRRSGTERLEPVIERAPNGVVRLNWNYYCVAEDVTPEEADLRERFFNFLQGSERVRESIEPVALKPGECVVFKDDRVLHGRNGFDPTRPSERFLWKSAFSSAEAH